MDISSFGRGILIIIVVGFLLEVFTNIFGIFPWAIAVVTATNSAAKEASTYNTFFNETRVSLETQLSNLPEATVTHPAKEWLPVKEDQIIANGVDSSIVQLAEKSCYDKSKVVMVEKHGYMGISYEDSVKPQKQDQQSIESSLGSTETKSKIGNYLDDLDIYTFTAYPLRFQVGGFMQGRALYIPWVYHSSSVGLHLYRQQLNN